jgi:hypothetical protein
VFDPSVDDSFLTGTPAIDMTFNGKGLDWDRRK